MAGLSVVFPPGKIPSSPFEETINVEKLRRVVSTTFWSYLAWAVSFFVDFQRCNQPGVLMGSHTRVLSALACLQATPSAFDTLLRDCFWVARPNQ
jgi:hypothetical protein